MRVFVTGGSGFIGTNLLHELVRAECQVLNYDRSPPLDPRMRDEWVPGDLLDRYALARALEAFQPSHVVHLAAVTDTTKGLALPDYETNTRGTQNLLDVVSANAKVQRLIVTSTQFVCRPGYIPQHDEDFSPHTTYGESKVIAERMTRTAALQCTWTIVRPTTIWGPWLFRHERQVFRLMKLGLYLHPGREPCIRSWGYVGNVAFQLRKVLEAPPGRVHQQVYYLGDPPSNLLYWVNAFSRRLSGRDARIVPRRIVKTLGIFGDILGSVKVPFPVTSSRYRSMTEDYPAPMERTLELTGPSPFTLENGVDETIRWLEDRPRRRVPPKGLTVEQIAAGTPSMDGEPYSRAGKKTQGGRSDMSRREGCTARSAPSGTAPEGA